MTLPCHPGRGFSVTEPLSLATSQPHAISAFTSHYDNLRAGFCFVFFYQGTHQGVKVLGVGQFCLLERRRCGTPQKGHVYKWPRLKGYWYVTSSACRQCMRHPSKCIAMRVEISVGSLLQSGRGSCCPQQ